MGNAHETLKTAADYVTLSNDEDGVAAFIRRRLLARDGVEAAI